jgi:pimeloyl-ACP methyl ester carboxylesterase
MPHSSLLRGQFNPSSSSSSSNIIRRRQQRQRRRRLSSSSSIKLECKISLGEIKFHTFRGHKVAYRETSSSNNNNSKTTGPCVLLIHGFGVSGYQYRDIDLTSIAKKTFAIDLIGFGKSDKPDSVDFSMEFWREQIIDFIKEVIQEPACLVGNSIGSLAAVHVASSEPELVRGVCLINCAGGMNNKVKQMPGDFDDFPIQYKLVGPIFKVVLAIIDTVLKIEPVATKIFNNVRSEENVRNALKNVYKTQNRVDELLVKSICDAAKEDGALKCFVNILTGDPGPRPEELMNNVECPMLIIWGTEDGITPLDFPLGRYFENLPKTRTNTRKTSFIKLDGQGHCVQDDSPELMNELLVKWIAEDGL